MTDWLEELDGLDLLSSREMNSNQWQQKQYLISHHLRELIDVAKQNYTQSVKDTECWELLNVRDSEVDKLKARIKLYEDQELGVAMECCKKEWNNEELKGLLKEVEWVGGSHYPDYCPVCGADEDKGHRDTCKLSKAINNA